jgi:ABC-type Fe3+/spermidine/putrescine transport system ATPase subunit
VPASLAARLTNRAQAFAIRPELIEVLPVEAPLPAGQIVCEGVLVDVLYHGASSRWHVRIDDSTTIVASQAETASAETLPAPGSRVRLAWSAASIVPLKE